MRRNLTHALIAPDARTIPGSPIAKAIMDVCRARQIDGHRLLRGTGVFENALQEAECISFSQLTKLIANAHKLCKGTDFSFQVGQALASSHYGGLLRGLEYCRDFNQVIRITSHFMHLVCPIVAFAIYRKDSQLVMIMRDPAGSYQNWVCKAEIVMSALYALSKRWTGSRLGLTFHFPFHRPRQMADYEMHLGRNLFFEQDSFSVRFDRSAVYARFEKYEPYVRHAVIGHYKKTYLRGVLLPEAIRLLLEQTPHISAADAAQLCGISVATLKRRLHELDVSFSQLVDAYRREQAVFLLKDCQMSNELSALKMAITDLANFRRAVKRWTGLTPAALRNR